MTIFLLLVGLAVIILMASVVSVIQAKRQRKRDFDKIVRRQTGMNSNDFEEWLNLNEFRRDEDKDEKNK